MKKRRYDSADINKLAKFLDSNMSFTDISEILNIGETSVGAYISRMKAIKDGDPAGGKMSQSLNEDIIREWAENNGFQYMPPAEDPTEEDNAPEGSDLDEHSTNELLLKILQLLSTSSPVGGSSIDMLSRNICSGLKKVTNAIEEQTHLMDSHLGDMNAKLGEMSTNISEIHDHLNKIVENLYIQRLYNTFGKDDDEEVKAL